MTMMPPNGPKHSSKMKSTADSEGPTAGTRVCLKNLPKNLTAHELRRFLADSLGNSTITDCRILTKNGKSRRMAFCGFATADMAATCVQKLNRAYCHNHKLVVEVAKLLPKKMQVDKSKASSHTKDNDSLLLEKSKEQIEKEKKLEQKKNDFLAVMGVTTEGASKKFWANDDGYKGTEEEEKNANEPKVSSSSDDSSSSSTEDDDDSVNDGPVLKTKTKAAKATSDLDFLRSKQVQTDDLDDELSATGGENASSKDSDDSDSDSSSSDSSVEDKLDEPRQTPETPLQPEVSKAEQQGKPQLSDTRLFLRNLPFSATEDDIRQLLSEYGTVTECHVPTDDQNQSKGFGFGSMSKASEAMAALEALDGTDFQGRLLHVLPARNPIGDDNDDNDVDESTLTYAQKQERLRKKNAESQTGWSASFVRSDAVVDNLAVRLGIRKGDVLNVKDNLKSGDAAVRLALAETAIIEENRSYFQSHGIDMDALVSVANPKNSDETSTTKKIERSKTMFLVKNLPHDTAQDELLKTFSLGSDVPTRILLPPSRTIAVVEYAHSNSAKACFRKLAYRRFKSVPLYLEWAPLEASSTNSTKESDSTSDNMGSTKEMAPSNEDAVASDEKTEDMMAVEDGGSNPTVYVKNLNFATTEEELWQAFSKMCKNVRNVRIPKKVAPGKAGQELRELSMGYGFVEFGETASLQKAMTKMQGIMLDGHKLELKVSNRKTTSTAVPKANSKNTKIMVRNVPFQANRKELLQLFGSFGQLKKVRLPKKFDGTHRGFAFCEYMTAKEALAAMKTLGSTHLYGRHLVLEWATQDDEDIDKLRSKAQRNFDSQVGSARPNKKIRFT